MGKLTRIVDEALECYDLYGAECVEVYREAGFREAIELLERIRLCDECCEYLGEAVDAQGVKPEWSDWCRRNCVCLEP